LEKKDGTPGSSGGTRVSLYEILSKKVIAFGGRRGRRVSDAGGGASGPAQGFRSAGIPTRGEEKDPGRIAEFATLTKNV